MDERNNLLDITFTTNFPALKMTLHSVVLDRVLPQPCPESLVIHGTHHGVFGTDYEITVKTAKRLRIIVIELDDE